MADSCKTTRVRIAESSVCTVDRCACGIVHLNVGPLTLRFEPSVVEAIWQTLGEALARLATPPSETRAPSAAARRSLS